MLPNDPGLWQYINSVRVTKKTSLENWERNLFLAQYHWMDDPSILWYSHKRKTIKKMKASHKFRASPLSALKFLHHILWQRNYSPDQSFHKLYCHKDVAGSLLHLDQCFWESRTRKKREKFGRVILLYFLEILRMNAVAIAPKFGDHSLIGKRLQELKKKSFIVFFYRFRAQRGVASLRGRRFKPCPRPNSQDDRRDCVRLHLLLDTLLHHHTLVRKTIPTLVQLRSST